MADRNLTFRVGAKDDASTTFSKIAQASKREMGKVQKDQDETASNGLKMARILAGMAEDLDDEFRKTEQAAERLGDALGPELRAKVDLDQIIADFRRAGLTFEEIEADAEQLAAAIKKIDDVSERAGAGVKQSMGNAADGVDRVAESGDQTRSVLANMVGNSTQDLGALGGIAGTAGMAIGQIGEYATEGGISLKSLAKAAGPMLLLAAATAAASSHFKAIADTKAFHQERVDSWVDAMRDGATATQAMRDSLEEAGKVEFRFMGSTQDITDELSRLGMNLDDFTRLTHASEEETNAWGEAMLAAGASTEDVVQVTLAAGQAHDDLASAETRAAVQAQVFGAATHATAEEMQAAKDAGDRYREALEELNDAQDAALGNNISLAEAMLNTADSLDEYRRTLQDAEATDREKQQAGLDLISTFQQEAEAAGRSAHDQAVASGNAAGAQQASVDAQIAVLLRLAQHLAPGSFLRQQIEDHIRALHNIPTTIGTEVRVNTSYGQGTTPLTSKPGTKFHDGGFVPGSTGQEVGITAQAGELVLSAAQQRNVAAALAGAGSGGPTQIIVQLDGRVLVDALVKQNRVNGSLPITVQAVS